MEPLFLEHCSSVEIIPGAFRQFHEFLAQGLWSTGHGTTTGTPGGPGKGGSKGRGEAEGICVTKKKHEITGWLIGILISWFILILISYSCVVYIMVYLYDMTAYIAGDSSRDHFYPLVASHLTSKKVT